MTLTLRHANVADSSDLARLASLDSAAPFTGDALVAFVDGEPWAAIELDTGTVVADPFRPSGELVDLLRLRASTLAGERRRSRRRLPRLLPRPA